MTLILKRPRIFGQDGRADRKVLIEREKCASLWPAHLGETEFRDYFFGVLWRGGVTGEDGVVAAGAGEQDGEADGGEHEDDRGPGGELGEEIGCSARSEGGLRSLAAEGSGEVGGLALLEQDDADEEERDDNVQDYEKDNHRE